MVDTMDLKNFKLLIMHGFLARRVLLRAFMLASTLSTVPLLLMLTDAGPEMLHTLSTSADCALQSGYSGPFMVPGIILYSKLWGSFRSVQCKEEGNLTTSVVRELMGKQMLNHSAKTLCVGEGSMSAVVALRDLGFSDVTGVYRHPFFSLKHKKFVYELDYEDNSYDFVLSRDLDKVSVPALLVLEIERVLKPGGIGAMLVGISGSDPTSLIRSATPVSSLLKTSSVLHVDYVNEFILVVFKKKLENTTYFEQYRLPADCPSITSSKDILDHMEPLVKEKPMGFEKSIAYLPKFIDVSSKKRLVYIDIGAGKHLNSNGTNWFLSSYPVDHNAFDVYFVDHNTSVMLSYVKRPGVSFVYHPGLAENRATTSSTNQASTDSGIVDETDPYIEDEGFDFLQWFKDTVQYAEFVVLRMNAGAVELKILADLFENGIICFVDELFLHCSDQMDSGGVAQGDCMDLFNALRRTGVYVHQWWGD